MQEKETVNTPAIIVLGIIGAVLSFVLIVALQALYYNFEEKEKVSKVYSQVPEDVARLRAEQETEINSYRWIDRENGVVGIPIDRAIELTVGDLEAEYEYPKAERETP